MAQLQKHKPIGESTGDVTEPPLREDAASSAGQAGEVIRPNHWLRPFLLLSAAFLIEEKRKLFDYPLLPENMTRPDSLKLVLPPGNLQLR